MGSQKPGWANSPSKQLDNIPIQNSHEQKRTRGLLFGFQKDSLNVMKEYSRMSHSFCPTPGKLEALCSLFIIILLLTLH